MEKPCMWIFKMWKPLVWTLINCKDIMEPIYIEVMILIRNWSLLWHFFSLTNILFSPSLTFCFTLFQLAIWCLFYFGLLNFLQILKHPVCGLSEYVKISAEQSILGSWTGCIPKKTAISTNSQRFWNCPISSCPSKSHWQVMHIK